MSNKNYLICNICAESHLHTSIIKTNSYTKFKIMSIIDNICIESHPLYSNNENVCTKFNSLYVSNR